MSTWDWQLIRQLIHNGIRQDFAHGLAGIPLLAAASAAVRRAAQQSMLLQGSSPRPDALERCHAFLRSNALAVVLVIAIGLWGTHVFRRGPVAFSGEQQGRQALPGVPPPAGPLLNDSQPAHPSSIPARTPPHYQVRACMPPGLTSPSRTSASD